MWALDAHTGQEMHGGGFHEPFGARRSDGALAGGRHQRYLDVPLTLTAPGTIADGNGILGSKDVSRVDGRRRDWDAGHVPQMKNQKGAPRLTVRRGRDTFSFENGVSSFIPDHFPGPTVTALHGVVTSPR